MNRSVLWRAIYLEYDNPPEYQKFAVINAEFIKQHGLKGGSAKLGQIENDHPNLAYRSANSAQEGDSTSSAAARVDS